MDRAAARREEAEGFSALFQCRSAEKLLAARGEAEIGFRIEVESSTGDLCLTATARQSLEALDREAGEFVRSGRYAEAAAALQCAIALAPEIAGLHSNLGFVFAQLGRCEDAVNTYARALQLRPDFADAHFSRALLLDRLGRFQEACAGFDAALALRPQQASAHAGLGNVLQALRRFDDAVASYDRAIAVEPSNASTHFNRGNALVRLRRNVEALESFDRSLALDPGLLPALNNRASLLCKLGRHTEALAGFGAALALAPNDPELLVNRANVLNELKRHTEALAEFDAVIAIRPDFAKAHVNQAIALFDCGRIDEAIGAYDRAIALEPRLADAHYGRAIALAQRKLHGEALASYAKAYALDPQLPFLLGKLLHQKAIACDWAGREAGLAELVRRIEDGEKATPPFPVLALIDSPDIQFKAAAIHARERADIARGAVVAPHRGHARIKLGYFSADFHDHATAVLMAELFERHDRARFELFAYSFGPDLHDSMRKRLVGAFDHFLDVRFLSDEAIAALARRHGIDIAIDLKGCTGDARPAIFARRTAPVQVNYLGYPGTLGASWYDYIIADTALIPVQDRVHYAEKIVALPDSYQPNDLQRPIAATPLSRTDLGLPEHAFVYCCFNNSYKITPAVFQRWMRILARVDRSVLWLLDENPLARENLRTSAKQLGISAERLVFAPRTPLSDHLARHRLADIFLDTLPYNAHTTASDALWAGLPVLTQMGHSFAGRVAASLLQAVGLPELITRSGEAYEAAAIALAHDPRELAALKQKLAANRKTAPLFDAARFACHIERAYAAMHVRSQSGLPPDHITVAL